MPNAPGPFTTLDVMNNKFPCEGPEVVPLYLNFVSASTYNVDLKALVQSGKISMIQSLYVDNADGNAPVTILTSIQQQRIIIPAGAQAYINGLFSGAQFDVTSTAAVVVKIFAQNFPVTNCVWGTGASGAPASSVSVVNFPPTQFVSMDRSQSWAFLPNGGAVTTAVTTTSVNVSWTAALGSNIRCVNVGAGVIHLKLGAAAQTATTQDLALAPNQSIILNTGGFGNMGVIGDANSTLNWAVGSGGI